VKVREVYKERRDAMLRALEKYMPKGVAWTKPEGGMFIWMTLPEGIDGEKLLDRAVKESKVAFVPGAAFYPDRSGRNTIRLSFSLNEPSVVEEGIKRLGELLRKA
jgi:DNA-binding transcriptional MocR family regulator